MYAVRLCLCAAWWTVIAQPAAGQRAGEAGICPLQSDGDKESALLKLAGPEARLKHTPHFVIAFEGQPALADEFVARLEGTWAAIFRFCERNRIETSMPRHRLEVIFFSTRTAYEHYATRIRFPAAGTYGVYHELSNRSAFYDAATDPQLQRMSASMIAARANLDQIEEAIGKIRGRHTVVELHYDDGRQEQMTRQQADRQIDASRRDLRTLESRRNNYIEHINRTVIQHETAHQVLYNVGVHARFADNPRWLVEGLACLFETPPGRDGTGIAAINQLRLKDFRVAVNGNGSLRVLNCNDFIEAVTMRRLASVNNLLGDPSLFGERGDSGAAHYALAWSLTHYLQRTHGQEFAGYLKAISTRSPQQHITDKQELALFDEYFGPVNTDFVKRWGSYVLSLPTRTCENEF